LWEPVFCNFQLQAQLIDELPDREKPRGTPKESSLLVRQVLEITRGTHHELQCSMRDEYQFASLVIGSKVPQQEL
jgi:hypothetical protein